MFDERIELTAERRAEVARLIELFCESITDRQDIALATRYRAELTATLLSWVRTPVWASSIGDVNYPHGDLVDK